MNDSRFDYVFSRATEALVVISLASMTATLPGVFSESLAMIYGGWIVMRVAIVDFLHPATAHQSEIRFFAIQAAKLRADPVKNATRILYDAFMLVAVPAMYWAADMTTLAALILCAKTAAMLNDRYLSREGDKYLLRDGEDT